MIVHLVLVALVGAAPEPAETAVVLVPDGPAPTASAVIDAHAALAPKAPPLSREAAGQGPGAPLMRLRLPTVGRFEVRAAAGPLPEVELADGARRSLASLLSDTPMAPHLARHVVTFTPEKTETPKDRGLDALVRVAAAIARASGGVAIQLPGARVVHPADFVINAVREGSALSIVWVGLELSGTTEEVALTSVGLARVGLGELQLGAPRRRVGEALVTFYELVAALVRRGADVPDGGALGRDADEALPVRRVPGPDGASVVTRVELPAR